MLIELVLDSLRYMDRTGKQLVCTFHPETSEVAAVSFHHEVAREFDVKKYEKVVVEKSEIFLYQSIAAELYPRVRRRKSIKHS